MRSLVGLVLLLIGGLLVPAATAGWWLRDTVVPENAYVRTVAPLSDDPAVKGAVRRSLVTGTGEALQPLPDPIAEKLEPVVRQAARTVVDSPAFDPAWREANRAAHEQLVGALSGDSGAVRVRNGGTVVLRLDPLTEAIRTKLSAAAPGLEIAVPHASVTYPVGDVQDLGRAQSAYRLLEDYGRLLPFVAALFILVGLAAARRRGPALAGTALVALLGLGGLWWTLGAARTSYVEALPPTVPRAAGEAYFDVLTSDLRTLMLYVAIGSAVALVLGAVGGAAGRK